MNSGRKTLMIQSLTAVVGILTAVMLLALPDPLAQRLAFASACTVFPQGSAVLLKGYTASEIPVSAQIKESSKETPKSVSTEIPDDIQKLIEEALLKAEHEKKDGDIKEITYGKKSATDDIDGLLIKDSTEESVDFSEIKERPLELSVDKEKPAVLLFHTHTTEGYEMLDRDWYASDTTSRTQDVTRNIVRVGDAVAEELEEAGFEVIHDRTVHDVRYTGAYDRSRETVRRHLEENPQIQVVIDIHRDAIQENDGTKIKAVKEINGKKAAQIMIISGAEDGGKVTDFPLWRDNLSFALKLHSVCEETASGIMRPLMFCYRKYNMDETPCSLLVEFGSEANTLDEAVYSGSLFGKALARLMNEYVKETK